MVGIYEELQGVVGEVMAEFKQGVIKYVKVTPGNGPADDPGPSTPTPYTLDAAARGVSQKYVTTGLAVATDLQLTMAVRSDVTPDVTGFIEMDGVSHKIVRVDNIPPAGVPVAHVIIFRK